MGESAKKATMEEVWAAIKASEDARREGEKALRESHLQTQKEVRELNESLKEANGNFNNKWGHFLENLLEGDLVNLLKGWDITVERTLPSITVKRPDGTIAAEYDLLAINGAEIVVVEVKTTLEKDAVGRFVERLEDFKNQLPVYKDKTLYGAVAYMRLKPKDYSKKFKHGDASQLAQEKGLLLIQSPGGAKGVSKIVNEKGFKPTEF